MKKAILALVTIAIMLLVCGCHSEELEQAQKQISDLKNQHETAKNALEVGVKQHETALAQITELEVQNSDLRTALDKEKQKENLSKLFAEIESLETTYKIDNLEWNKEIAEKNKAWFTKTKEEFRDTTREEELEKCIEDVNDLKAIWGRESEMFDARTKILEQIMESYTEPECVEKFDQYMVRLNNVSVQQDLYLSNEGKWCEAFWGDTVKYHETWDQEYRIPLEKSSEAVTESHIDMNRAYQGFLQSCFSD